MIGALNRPFANRSKLWVPLKWGEVNTPTTLPLLAMAPPKVVLEG